MEKAYQARWISKGRLAAIRKDGRVTRGVVLESFNGFLIVEPVGSDLGDGKPLSREEADYELQPVWCPGPKVKLTEARKLLGLEPVAAPVAELLTV